MDGSPITVTWVLHRDQFRYRGAVESTGEVGEFPEAIIKATNKEVELKMPPIGGGYRLYAYVRSVHNGSAVANLSLYVDGLTSKPSP